MSGDSEVLKLKPPESESIVPENNRSKKGETLKRNFCYVCNVQCTGNRNFLEHQRGQKHRKKLEAQETIKKGRQKQNNSKKNSSKKSYKSIHSLKPHEKNSEPELHEADNSNSIVDSSADKDMNNSNRKVLLSTPKYKNKHYNNSSHQNKYSKRQNSRYSYSKYFEGNQEYYEHPTHSYTRWGPPIYPNPPIHNNFNNYGSIPSGQYYTDPMYNATFQNEYFSGDRNAGFQSHDYANQMSHVSFTSGEPENPIHNFLGDETSDIGQLELNSVSPETVKKSSSNNKSNSINNLEQGSVSNSTPTFEANDVNSSVTISEIANCSNSKVGEKKRLRTRSLSSADVPNIDKSLKGGNECLSVDSDGTPDEQKLKEYTTSLLETNPNRISLMIQHPSSHKEKAVLNHIMTSFSKTKRKENLSRKLRSNSLGSAGNDDGNLDVHSISSENEEISVILPSVQFVQTSTGSDQTRCRSDVEKNGNSSKECNLEPLSNNEASNNAKSLDLFLANQSSKKSSKVNVKSKENSLSVSVGKGHERRKETSSESIYPKKSAKRKNSEDDTSNKGKKQRSYGGKNFKTYSRTTELKDLSKDATPVVVTSLNQPSSIQINHAFHSETAPVKEEVAYCADKNQAACLVETNEDGQNQILDFNTQFSVETLIELFASGNVSVKKEFNDPAIDAIKGVDPDELMTACSNDSLVNNSTEKTLTTIESNIRSNPPISVPKLSVQGNTNCINPVILGSTVDSDNITPVSMTQKNNTVATKLLSLEKAKDPNSSSSLRKAKDQNSLSSLEKTKDQNSSSMSDASKKDSLSELEKLNLITRTKAEFPHLIILIEKLREIASQEETVKESITEAKHKINEYSSLLEEWKNKKKKFHYEEDKLRKKRNDIIQLMQNAVKVPKDSDTEESETRFEPGVHSTPGNDKIDQNSSKVQEGQSAEESSCSTSSSSPEVHAKKQKSKCSDSDEILILPSPVKAKPPEIIIVDEAEDGFTETESNRNLTAGEVIPNFPNQGSHLFDTKNLTAHSTVINSIVVFDDFVYTCSNDNTARRFSLKDTSQTITYLHTAKNVTEVVVEKVQNEALVFTSCSTRVLSLFIASNGTKIKTFFQSSSIKSICKGWGKFYAAMEDGTVNVYNWKYEEKEFIKTQNQAYRIATVHQGGLHILVILTTDGHVCLRDAKTSLLIRLIQTSVKFPAWLTVHNDFVCLSSSDRTISVLNIQSGRVEKQMELSQNHATGLAVCDDHIFTISYSGIVCCVNKDTLTDVTLFFGAGKTGLTCIHVYQNWVFTGNRKGDISVFRFDPCSKYSCKIGKCKTIFGSKEDLAFHFESKHLKKKNFALCQWEKCTFIFPVHYGINEKLNHLKRHVLLEPRRSIL